VCRRRHEQAEQRRGDDHHQFKRATAGGGRKGCEREQRRDSFAVEEVSSTASGPCSGSAVLDLRSNVLSVAFLLCAQMFCPWHSCEQISAAGD
jgi:hypothetical protein